MKRQTSATVQPTERPLQQSELRIDQPDWAVIALLAFCLLAAAAAVEHWTLADVRLSNWPAVAQGASSILVAWFTFRLTRLNSRQLQVAETAANAAWSAAKTAEKALTVLEGPFVFAFGLEKLENGRISDGDLEPVARLNIANYGKTPAIIDNMQAGLHIAQSGFPQAPLRIDAHHELVVSPTMQAGDQRATVKFEAPAGIDFIYTSTDEVVPEITNGQSLYMWIVIDYRDVFASRHRSSACWELNANTSRFEKFGNEDFNYVRRLT